MEKVQCDVCGEIVDEVSRVIAYGIETYACDKCLNNPNRRNTNETFEREMPRP